MFTSKRTKKRGRLTLESKDKPSRRRYRRRIPRRLVPSAGTLGKTLRQKFRYSTLIRLDASTGGVSGHIFSANGMYDPDISGTGHQPLGYDQFMGTFYNHYTVLSSRIKCTVMSTDSNSLTGQSLFMIETSGNNTLDTSKIAILDRNAAAAVTCANAQQSKIVYRSCNISKFLGQDVLSEDNNAGAPTSNPTEQVYFHMYTTGADDISNPAIVNVLVVIDYDVVLHEPKLLASS